MADAFTIDEPGDRNAYGASRYATYLRNRGTAFEDEPGVITTRPAEFAYCAYRLGSSPHMAPGYVQTHPRVIGAELYPGVESGGLIADVMLASSAVPPGLEGLPGWAGWHHRDGRPVELSEAVLAAGGSVTTQVRAQFLIGVDRLYVPVDAPGRLTVADAKASVLRLVAALNAELAPVLAGLEAGR